VEHPIVISEGGDVEESSPWGMSAYDVEKIRQQILAEEDAEIFRILDEISKNGF
jgi:hypothetical protein